MKSFLKSISVLFILTMISSCMPMTSSLGVTTATDFSDAPSNDKIDDGDSNEDGQSAITYTIVDTGQDQCFDDAQEIACPSGGDTYFGQDAQYSGNTPSYRDNGDGTVTDLNTGLMWIQDADEKVSYYDGIQSADGFEFAGYDDWRVPTIKELYSLIDFSGIDDAESGTDPFIDDSVFAFEYGDTDQGDRLIDSQWITSTIYESAVMNGEECFFGVNFADGRIKCYPTGGPNLKGYFLRLVRGDAYGENEFMDNEDGTISDLATGLMWQSADSGDGMDWPDALGYCEDLSLAGYDDWRLPNAKELQSIVDYTRSPDTTASAAISPLFETTSITNELGQEDFAYYWTSTTHEGARGGDSAVYISFGRGMGSMRDHYMDVHGAGSQRSDPKTGDIDDFPYTMGPQGDVRRLENYVRCVRGGVSAEIITGGVVDDEKSNMQHNSGMVSEQPGETNQPNALPHPDLSSAAAALGISLDTLRDALGGMSQGPPDLKAAAAVLGISEQDLVKALGVPKQTN